MRIKLAKRNFHCALINSTLRFLSSPYLVIYAQTTRIYHLNFLLLCVFSLVCISSLKSPMARPAECTQHFITTPRLFSSQDWRSQHLSLTQGKRALAAIDNIRIVKVSIIISHLTAAALYEILKFPCRMSALIECVRDFS